MLVQIENNIGSLNVPVQVVRTHPLPEESFWVNLLGRGYPAPNRTFRWCTDRMKIRPTSRFIREQVSHAGEAILLLGVRSARSLQIVPVASRATQKRRSGTSRRTPITRVSGFSRRLRISRPKKSGLHFSTPARRGAARITTLSRFTRTRSGASARSW